MSMFIHTRLLGLSLHLCSPHFPELTGFSELMRNQDCFWDSAIIIIRLVEGQAAGRYCSQSSEQWGSLDQDPTHPCEMEAGQGGG